MAARMTSIRPFTERDLPQVTSLYEREIRSGHNPPPRGLAGYFRRTFLEHPWVDPDLPSLVFEAEDGRIAGFLGSHVRRFRFDGRPITLACSGHLVTEPSLRHLAPGAFLLRRYFDGPQDVTITDGANAAAQRLWERLGGLTLHLSCVDWVRVLRPVAFGLQYAARRRSDGFARAVAPVLPRRRRRARAQEPLRLEELTPRALVEGIRELASSFRLHPDYDEGFAEWLFRELDAVSTRGRMLRSLARTEDGRVLGWWVAYASRGAVGEVMQVAAADGAEQTVLEHLCREAGEVGAAALRGRIEPRMLPALWARNRLLRYTGGALVQSRSDELLQVLRSRRTLLTRLDGEWWMGHHTEPFA
jgi:hypothetical protein